MVHFRRILVPMDESDLSDRVLDAALGNAAWLGADVVLLHVLRRAPDVHGGRELEVGDALKKDVDALLTRATERNAGRFAIDRARIHAHVRSGDIVDAICKAAEELEADLVVMGTHGRHGLLERFTGSLTEKVVAKAPASVFVVRPEGYPYLQET